MLLSMDGWGRLVGRLVRPHRPVDLGLSLIWGAAATLVLGGVGCALHVATRPFLLAQLLAGAAISAVWRLLRWRPALSCRRLFATAMRPNAYLIMLVALAAVTAEYLRQLGDWMSVNTSDDPLVYFYLAEKILQTGSPYDPFLSRRPVSLGGDDYLHAQFLTLGKPYQLHVVDAGIGALLVLALLVGAVAPNGLRRVNVGHLAIPLLLFLMLGEVRINVASLLTSAAAFFGAYRTLLWMHDEAPARAVLPLRRLALLAACVAATCLLRASNAVPVAAFAGLAVIARHFTPSITRRAATSALRDVALLGSFCFLCLLPWLIVLRESTGTLVYPLVLGNVTPGFAILKAEPGLAYNLRHILDDLTWPVPISPSLLLLTAGLLPLGWGVLRSRAPRDFVALLSVVCFFSLCFISYMGGAFEAWVNARYYYGTLVATGLAIAVSIVPRGGGSRKGVASPRALLVIACVVAQVVATREASTKNFHKRIDVFESARTNAERDAKGDLESTQHYQEVQGHLPEREAVAVIVNEPYRFDMRRNEIYSLDGSPGGLGPKPGFPVFKGADALANYFLQNGIRYLIAADFHDRINIDSWRSFLHQEHSYLGYEAPIVVDALESLDKLVHTRPMIYQKFGMKVIDLREPPRG
jgi:hypothetical protein